MPGTGPAPKEPSQRARRNKDVVSQTRLPFETFEPPELPDGIDWHPMTRNMWAAWGRSPMAALMTEVDWVYMLDTALMHHTMWEKGRWEFAAEVRIRSAQFGATPLDRLRLRIVWAVADQKDATIPQTAPVPASRSKYAGLAAVVPIREGQVFDGDDPELGSDDA